MAGSAPQMICVLITFYTLLRTGGNCHAGLHEEGRPKGYTAE